MKLLEKMHEISEHVKALVALKNPESGVDICGYHEPEMQVYCGIRKMADAAGEELIEPKEASGQPTAHFFYNGVRFFQIGTYAKIRKVKYL